MNLSMRFSRCSFLTVLAMIVLATSVSGQNRPFTHQDTLRGAVTKERVWWDLTYYHLEVKVNPADSTLKGAEYHQLPCVGALSGFAD